MKALHRMALALAGLREQNQDDRPVATPVFPM